MRLNHLNRSVLLLLKESRIQSAYLLKSGSSAFHWGLSTVLKLMILMAAHIVLQKKIPQCYAIKKEDKHFFFIFAPMQLYQFT